MSDMFQLVSSFALLGAAIAIILRLRYRDQLARDTRRLTYQLEFPRDLTLDQVTAFVRTLGRLRPSRGWLFGRDSAVFEGIGQAGSIEHRLRLPQHEADVLLRQLRGVVPGLRATPLPEPALPKTNWLRRIHATTTARLLRTDVAGDFAVSLLNTLQPLGPNETLVYQLVVFPVAMPSARQPDESAAQLLPPWLSRSAQLLTATPPPTRGRQAWADLEAKTAEPWFGVVGTVGAAALPLSRAHLLVGRVMASLHLLDQDGVALVPRWLPAGAHRWLTRAATRPPLSGPMYLNARETAALLAWPTTGPTVPGLELRGGRVLPPVASTPTTGRVLGRAVYDSYERPIAVSESGTLMHQLVTGATGTGKSTLLLNEITQDMQAGRGVVLIDPGGDLARDVVDRVPAHRVADLIYLDPSDPQPVGINPLACAPDEIELVADQFLALVHDRSASWGPRLEELLKNALVLLAATPNMTLLELPTVLTHRRFRASLLGQLDGAFSPTVGAYFSRFDQWADGDREQAVSAVLNKVSPLTDRRQLRAMLGRSQPGWTVRDVIDRGKILVVALPEGQVGAPAVDLLGGLIVHMIWNAALHRTTVDRGQRQPVALYIDEVARFLGSSPNLADMLARARGHGLGLVAALQHLDQAPRALRRALLSEARTKVAFQAGPDDAHALARTYGPPVQPEDLQQLEARTALATVVAADQVQPPVTIQTAPPPAVSGAGELARTTSRHRYGRSPASVEEEVAARQAPVRPPDRPRRQIPASSS